MAHSPTTVTILLLIPCSPAVLTSLFPRHTTLSCCTNPAPARPTSKSERRQRPYGYWTNPVNIHSELEAYLRHHKNEPVMPTHSELLAAGRRDLAGAIRRYGPWKKTADEAGLTLSSFAKPRSLNLVYCTKLQSGRLRPYMYWRDFDNLKRELQDYVAGKGVKERKWVIPKASELETAGRSDLIRAIRIHGGWHAVAEKLGIDVGWRVKDRWGKFERVEREVKRVMDNYGDANRVGVMPTAGMLKKHGATGLYRAISRRWGGMPGVAGRMGLKLAVVRKPRGFWEREENVRTEVMKCLTEICALDPDRDGGVMLTRSEFLKIGRGDVSAAIERGGGLEKIAAQLGLTYVAGRKNVRAGMEKHSRLAERAEEQQ